MPAHPLPSHPPSLPAGSLHGRLPIVDIARGVAIAQMIVYHLCYDLNYFSWIHVALTRDAPWIAWRTAILAQFLFLVGVALALRRANETSVSKAKARAAFWKRWGQIAGCALLVSLASWWLFGPRWIWFGVLHFVALAQLLLLAAPSWGRLALLLGMLVLGAGSLLQLPLFASDALSWIGFSPTKPRTEDFVPLFPWLGVVLLGMGASVIWQRSNASWARWTRARGTEGWRWAAWLGRWPLTVYMVHQPLLFSALYAVRALRQNLG